MDDKEIRPNRYMNPYLAGVLLGLVLLASFLVLGAGLGASAGIARIAAGAEMCVLRSHTLASEYFGSWGTQPLRYYLVFMFVGIFVGALFSALLAGRIRPSLERAAGFSGRTRAILALVGGILVGFSSRLASGCTSGQALTGSAQLMTGSFVFMICVFVGGYGCAYLVRRQWND
jgi:uncharacterized membrane protein YedE/YeeE